MPSRSGSRILRFGLARHPPARYYLCVYHKEEIRLYPSFYTFLPERDKAQNELVIPKKHQPENKSGITGEKKIILDSKSQRRSELPTLARPIVSDFIPPSRFL